MANLSSYYILAINENGRIIEPLPLYHAGEISNWGLKSLQSDDSQWGEFVIFRYLPQTDLDIELNKIAIELNQTFINNNLATLSNLGGCNYDGLYINDEPIKTGPYGKTVFVPREGGILERRLGDCDKSWSIFIVPGDTIEETLKGPRRHSGWGSYGYDGICNYWLSEAYSPHWQPNTVSEAAKKCGVFTLDNVSYRAWFSRLGLIGQRDFDEFLSFGYWLDTHRSNQLPTTIKWSPATSNDFIPIKTIGRQYTYMNVFTPTMEDIALTDIDSAWIIAPKDLNLDDPLDWSKLQIFKIGLDGQLYQGKYIP